MSKSTQLTGADANPPVLADASDYFGKLRVIRATYVTDGTETVGTEIELARLHKGLRAVPLGKLMHQALGTSTTLAVGINGTSGLLAAAESTSSAGEVALDDESGWGYENTQDSLSIVATVGGATLTAGRTIDCFLVVTQE